MQVVAQRCGNIFDFEHHPDRLFLNFWEYKNNNSLHSYQWKVHHMNNKVKNKQGPIKLSMGPRLDVNSGPHSKSSKKFKYLSKIKIHYVNI